MRILSRYVLREFVVPLFYCLAGFVSIYVLFELFGSFSRMMEAKLPLGVIVLYFCGYLAPYVHYLVPAALMLATLYTMWMFCRHSEIVAMRASGIGFLTIVMPLLSVATLMAFFVIFVNESFVPRYGHWAAQMKTCKFDLSAIQKAGKIVFRSARDGRLWNIDAIEDIRGCRLKGVHVTVERPGGERLQTVTADRAEYLDGEWWFFNTKVQHHGAGGQEIATPTPELDAIPTRCFPEFRERPGDFILQNRPWKFNSIRERHRYIRTHPELSPERRADLSYDLWAQVLAPFACLIITLFAIPAGIASGRQSVFKGILGALGMYFAFYGVTILGMILAKNHWCPPIAAALFPDVLFLVLGVRAFLKQR